MQAERAASRGFQNRAEKLNVPASTIAALCSKSGSNGNRALSAAQFSAVTLQPQLSWAVWRLWDSMKPVGYPSI